MSLDARVEPSVHDLSCEYKRDPLGIDVKHPRLSWKIACTRRSVSQSAYQILVAEIRDALVTHSDLLWDSGKVVSGESIHWSYAGPVLHSSQHCYWQLTGDGFALSTAFPANTRATVRLPFAGLGQVTEGGRPLDGVEGLGRAYQDGSDAVLELGSGQYAFAYPCPALARNTAGA